MIILTREEFLEETDIDLYDELNDGLNDSSIATEKTLKRWSKILYSEANKQSLVPIPDDDKLTPKQIAAIKEAICNLGLYYKAFGDIKALGGKEVTGHEVVPKDIIEDLHQAKLVIKSLWGVII